MPRKHADLFLLELGLLLHALAHGPAGLIDRPPVLPGPDDRGHALVAAQLLEPLVLPAPQLHDGRVGDVAGRREVNLLVHFAV